MPTRRMIKSVLEGFLGTFTSRYADWRGYWLHGQLPFDAAELDIDLMETPPNEDSPLAMARRIAVRRFKEQLAKSGLDVAVVCSAGLKAHMSPEVVQGWQGDYRSCGRMVEFVATAVTDNGHRYERKRTVFVAPHDPTKERRRLPADWGS